MAWYFLQDQIRSTPYVNVKHVPSKSTLVYAVMNTWHRVFYIDNIIWLRLCNLFWSNKERYFNVCTTLNELFRCPKQLSRTRERFSEAFKELLRTLSLSMLPKRLPCRLWLSSRFQLSSKCTALIAIIGRQNYVSNQVETSGVSATSYIRGLCHSSGPLGSLCRSRHLVSRQLPRHEGFESHSWARNRLRSVLDWDTGKKNSM